MRYDKHEKAIALFHAIGEIDDRLIHEATVYRPKKAILSRTLLIAACLVFSMMLSVGAFLITMQTKKEEDVGTQFPSEDGVGVNTLDEIILYGNNAEITSSSADSIEFFGGEAYLVWQRTDTGEIFVSRALTSYEVEALRSEIPKGTQIDENDSEPLCRIWILLGDGTAISPHLKPSDGNVGVGELFDYRAELIPSNAFNSKVSEILN